MRVHNLTDVPTQALRAAGLVNVALNVGGTIIWPGKSEVVSSLGTNADRFLRIDAIFVGDEPPAGYTPTEAPVEAPMRHSYQPLVGLLPLALKTTVTVTDRVSVSPLSASAGSVDDDGPNEDHEDQEEPNEEDEY